LKESRKGKKEKMKNERKQGINRKRQKKKESRRTSEGEELKDISWRKGRKNEKKRMRLNIIYSA
jgi:hypothetical protein